MLLSRRIVVAAVLMLVCLLLLLAGCGGGSSRHGGTTAAPAASGSAAFTVRWPERSRLIPFASNSIKVRLMRGDAFQGERLLVRPAGGGETSAVFERLSTGDATATAEAYPNADGTGVAQASAQVTFTIVGGQTTNLRLTMNSTIDRIEITPPAPSLPVGQSVALTATAKNAASEVVLIAGENLRWRSLNTAVATVDAAGKVTAVAQGNANIEVTETESGKVGINTINVVVADLTGGRAVFNPANGHYYQAVVVPNGILWDAARDAANAAGGYLAAITSAAENQFVFSLVDAPQYWRDHTAFSITYSMGPWLGGYQPPSSAEPAGGWLWVTGEPWSYTNWYPQSPNNQDGVENRLTFHARGAGARGPNWDDIASFSKVKAYVVEWDSQPPSRTLVYSSDFQGTIGPEWSWNLTESDPLTASDILLGRLKNHTIRLSLSGLPAHGRVTVAFDLYILNSWDGNGPPPIGGEIWSLKVADGGPTLLHTNFNNNAGNQSYPGTFPTDSYPARTGAVVSHPLPSYTVYRILKTFAHTGNAVALEFAGAGLEEAVGNEGWAIDDIEVRVLP